ncbi:MAG: hypothetical protein HZB53_15810 [Chloroflexi bacterium]|nr:hypothetical protein [Chloroflexota bacterium]
MTLNPTSTVPVAPPPKKGGPWLWIAGGCGCLVVLCLFVAAAGWLYVSTNKELQALFSDTPTPTATAFVLPTTPPTDAPIRTIPTVRGITTPAATPAATSAAPRTTPTAAGPTGRSTPGISLTIPPIRLPTIGGATPAAGGAAGFGKPRFAVGVLNDDTPIDVLDAFPQGTTVVYAVWDYSKMQDGQTWRREWQLNGKTQTDLVKETAWQGGNSGVWWVSLYNKEGVSVGDWTLNLYVDNKLQQTSKFRVDASPSGQPNFTPIVFAENRDAKGGPVDPLPADNAVLDSGVTQVHAFFNGIAVPKGTKFTTQWFYNGQPDTNEQSFTWDTTPTDSYWVRYFKTDGSELLSGVYEVKIKIGTRLVKVASVTVP